MTYKYTAYTSDKRIVAGTIEATSANTAADTLYKAGYARILSLKEVHPKTSLEKLIPTFFGIKPQDVIDFSHQMATLLDSGIALVSALRLLEGQASKSAFRKVIGGLLEELEGGKSFSQAVSRYPQVFPDTYYRVIRASEQSGNIDVGLRQIADYLEKAAATTAKVTRALAYPSLVLVMAIGVFVLLITVALPPLVALFKSLGAQLPPATRAVIAMADFFNAYKLPILIVGLVIIASIVISSRLAKSRQIMETIILRLPVIGSISLERNVHQFCQTTSMLLSRGLPLSQIMETTIHTVGNVTIRRALEQVKENLIQGQSLSKAISTHPLFPSLLVEMIVVGENTGTLDANLATLSNYYEQRVEQRIRTLVAIMEPALIVMVGLVVIFIAISMVSPLYSMLKSIY